MHMGGQTSPPGTSDGQTGRSPRTSPGLVAGLLRPACCPSPGASTPGPRPRDSIPPLAAVIPANRGGAGSISCRKMDVRASPCGFSGRVTIACGPASCWATIEDSASTTYSLRMRRVPAGWSFWTLAASTATACTRSSIGACSTIPGATRSQPRPAASLTSGTRACLQKRWPADTQRHNIAQACVRAAHSITRVRSVPAAQASI